MVKFPFRIGKAFLDYHWHPITIPKDCYLSLEQEKLVVNIVPIVSPYGKLSGKISYSVAGYGPYYQIKMEEGHVSDPMIKFKIGQRIIVEIQREDGVVCVTMRAN